MMNTIGLLWVSVCLCMLSISCSASTGSPQSIGSSEPPLSSFLPSSGSDASVASSVGGPARSGYLIWRNFARQPHLYSPPFLQQLHNFAYRSPGIHSNGHSDRMLKPMLSALDSNAHDLTGQESHSNGRMLSFRSPIDDLEESESGPLSAFDDFDDLYTIPKRDQDYGHMRFGRTSGRLSKRPLDKKIESDYGHFRFG
jgi:hypothetical protein